MLKFAVCAALAASVSFAAETVIPARNISGNYIEARTADVFTGPCFANGEVEQVGTEAVFGWKIKNGSWNGVDITGLSVVGVVRAEHTIGNLSEPINRAKSVIIVDEKATAEQRKALQGFATKMAGDLLSDVLAVTAAPIDFAVANNNIHGGTVKLTAGSLAEIQTRAMSAADHICGNEDVYYEPLAKMDHAMPTFSLENSYTGKDLGATWHNRLKRSSFVGTFQVPSE